MTANSYAIEMVRSDPFSPIPFHWNRMTLSMRFIRMPRLQRFYAMIKSACHKRTHALCDHFPSAVHSFLVHKSLVKLRPASPYSSLSFPHSWFPQRITHAQTHIQSDWFEWLSALLPIVSSGPHHMPSIVSDLSVNGRALIHFHKFTFNDHRLRRRFYYFRMHKHWHRASLLSKSINPTPKCLHSEYFPETARKNIKTSKRGSIHRAKWTGLLHPIEGSQHLIITMNFIIFVAHSRLSTIYNLFWSRGPHTISYRSSV